MSRVSISEKSLSAPSASRFVQCVVADNEQSVRDEWNDTPLPQRHKALMWVGVAEQESLDIFYLDYERLPPTVTGRLLVCWLAKRIKANA